MVCTKRTPNISHCRKPSVLRFNFSRKINNPLSQYTPAQVQSVGRQNPTSSDDSLSGDCRLCGHLVVRGVSSCECRCILFCKWRSIDSLSIGTSTQGLDVGFWLESLHRKTRSWKVFTSCMQSCRYQAVRTAGNWEGDAAFTNWLNKR